MNLQQFLERWPSKQGRLFLFAGGKDHDRLSVFYNVVDHWRKDVDRMDTVRLHNPSFFEIDEECRRDPIVGKYRLVVATEARWDDPDSLEDATDKRRAQQRYEALARRIENFPRNLVLIMSTPADNPGTKNPLAQGIIRKGYWTVLRTVDVDSARELLTQLSGWDDDQLIDEVVEVIGTSPADLIAFLRVLRLGNVETPAQIRLYLGMQTRASVFDVVEAIVMKDRPKALNSLSEDVPLNSLIGALDRKFTSLIQFSSEMRKGRTPKEAALALRLPGFIVHGLYQATKRWTAHELLDLWPTLAEFSQLSQRPASAELLVTTILSD